MRRQRGFGWIEVIVILAIVGIIVATVAGIYHVGKKAGVDETTATYAKRDNEALRKANTEIKRLEDEARATEQRHATALAAVSASFQKDLADAKLQKDRDVSAARAGALSLRFRAEGPRIGCPGGAGQAAPGPGGRDGTADTELPREIAANLFALADDADEVTRQLSACQAIVRADRDP